MKFVRSTREELVEALTGRVRQELQKGSVTLLVPGGSNIQAVVSLMKNLSGENNSRLTLMLSDERFGPIGHSDSNYFQMKQAGLNLHGAKFVEALRGAPLDETIRIYGEELERAITGGNITIAFLGMGADGHIAGIMPHSPAFETVHEWAVGYEASDFTRLTMTPYALSQIDVAYIGAYGSEKGSALNALATQEIAPIDQPAQLLKNVPEVVVYNDILQVDA